MTIRIASSLDAPESLAGAAAALAKANVTLPAELRFNDVVAREIDTRACLQVSQVSGKITNSSTIDPALDHGHDLDLGIANLVFLVQRLVLALQQAQ